MFQEYFTEDHQIFGAVRKFVEKEIKPHVEAWEDEELFPIETVYKKMADAGLLGIGYRSLAASPATSSCMSPSPKR